MESKIEKLISKTPNDRYDYFIKNVRVTDSVYVLYNQLKGEIALNIDKNNKSYLYLFPNEYSARLFIEANPEMSKYQPHKWELTFFLNNAIGRLKTENTKNAFIFPNPKGVGLNVSFDKIESDINNQ